MVFLVRLSPDAAMLFVLMLFLFPAVWGGALLIVALFSDLKRALGRAISYRYRRGG